jgi:hypothetical protein
VSLSEIITIIIHFHRSNYRTFKVYYKEHVWKHLIAEIPKRVSYSRFVRLMGQAFVPLTIYLLISRGQCTGISFVDSTSIKVCHNRRITRNKVFAGIASRGKTAVGWFYGFKLHLAVNDQGEILAFYLTLGNIYDRKPVSQDIFGKVFADKGYISKQLFEDFLEHDVNLHAIMIHRITPKVYH